MLSSLRCEGCGVISLTVEEAATEHHSTGTLDIKDTEGTI
jgi:hypothetical protein